MNATPAYETPTRWLRRAPKKKFSHLEHTLLTERDLSLSFQKEGKPRPTQSSAPCSSADSSQLFSPLVQPSVFFFIYLFIFVNGEWKAFPGSCQSQCTYGDADRTQPVPLEQGKLRGQRCPCRDPHRNRAAEMSPCRSHRALRLPTKFHPFGWEEAEGMGKLQERLLHDMPLILIPLSEGVASRGTHHSAPEQCPGAAQSWERGMGHGQE